MDNRYGLKGGEGKVSEENIGWEVEEKGREGGKERRRGREGNERKAKG